MNATQLVGILNLTPDSFSDGGQYIATAGQGRIDIQGAIQAANTMFELGAHYVDVGGESTRPNAAQLSSKHEWDRIIDVLSVLIPAHPGRVSVDSYHPEIHRQLANRHFGEFIINDVTGFNNPAMIDAAADTGMPCIISHLPARYGSDIQAAHGADSLMDSIEEVAQELLNRQGALIKAGVPKDKIILDPGIGFGKTPALNAQLLEFPAYIRRYDPEVKVMIGYSRKRFLGDNRMELEPNLRAGRSAIAAGADFLRVHDIAGHLSLVKPQ